MFSSTATLQENNNNSVIRTQTRVNLNHIVTNLGTFWLHSLKTENFPFENWQWVRSHWPKPRWNEVSTSFELHNKLKSLNVSSFCSFSSLVQRPWTKAGFKLGTFDGVPNIDCSTAIELFSRRRWTSQMLYYFVIWTQQVTPWVDESLHLLLLNSSIPFPTFAQNLNELTL